MNAPHAGAVPAELTKEDCYLPHHRADGTLVLRGVQAAGGALAGQRGGVKLDAAEKKKALRHLTPHYRDFDREPPEINFDEDTGGDPTMEKEIEKLKAELADKQKALDVAVGDKTKLQADFDDAKKKYDELVETRKVELATARWKEIQAFAEKGVAAGKLLPRWLDAGLVRFLEMLPDGAVEPPVLPDDAAVSFAEGEVKLTPRAWFEKFLESLPAVIDFKRVAANEKISPARADEFEEEGHKIADAVNPNPKGGA
jgi:Skp family chaperone for outer membrane proteins